MSVMELHGLEALIALIEHCAAETYRLPKACEDSLAAFGADLSISRDMVPDVIPASNVWPLLSKFSSFPRETDFQSLTIGMSMREQGFGSEKIPTSPFAPFPSTTETMQMVPLETLMALIAFMSAASMQERIQLSFWVLDRDATGFVTLPQILHAVDPIMRVAEVSRILLQPGSSQRASLAKQPSTSHRRTHSSSHSISHSDVTEGDRSRDVLSGALARAFSEQDVQGRHKLYAPQLLQLVLSTAQHIAAMMVKHSTQSYDSSSPPSRELSARLAGPVKAGGLPLQSSWGGQLQSRGGPAAGGGQLQSRRGATTGGSPSPPTGVDVGMALASNTSTSENRRTGQHQHQPSADRLSTPGSPEFQFLEVRPASHEQRASNSKRISPYFAANASLGNNQSQSSLPSAQNYSVPMAAATTATAGVALAEHMPQDNYSVPMAAATTATAAGAVAEHMPQDLQHGASHAPTPPPHPPTPKPNSKAKAHVAITLFLQNYSAPMAAATTATAGGAVAEHMPQDLQHGASHASTPAAPKASSRGHRRSSSLGGLMGGAMASMAQAAHAVGRGFGHQREPREPRRVLGDIDEGVNVSRDMAHVEVEMDRSSNNAVSPSAKLHTSAPPNQPLTKAILPRSLKLVIAGATWLMFKSK
eukprot:gene1637-33028_t